MWKIEKIVSKGDYNYAVVKDHPSATKNGYVLEHRIIIENYLGRILNSNEVVHHDNECKKDNRIENLVLTTKKDHAILHGLRKGHILVEMKCPQCKKLFIIRRNQTFYVKKKGNYNCCSRHCRGKFSSNIQHYGLTHEVELAILENLVREFSSLDNLE